MTEETKGTTNTPTVLGPPTAIQAARELLQIERNKQAEAARVDSLRKKRETWRSSSGQVHFLLRWLFLKTER